MQAARPDAPASPESQSYPCAPAARSPANCAPSPAPSRPRSDHAPAPPHTPPAASESWPSHTQTGYKCNQDQPPGNPATPSVYGRQENMPEPGIQAAKKLTGAAG